MIRVLSGDNDFERTRRLRQLQDQFDGSVERFDGAELTPEQLADIFAGQTLFGDTRLIVIDTPSAHKQFWQDIAIWAERLSDTTELILIEAKPDKRTAGYKWLKSHATVEEFTQFSEKDINKVITWLQEYARTQQVQLTSTQTKRLVARGGVDQSMLSQAIDKLRLAPHISDEWIDAVIEPSPTENVFALFETALQGDDERVGRIVADLRLTEDPYRVFGLMHSQVLQLATLVYGDSDIVKVAADTGAKSSYPLQKLAPYARRMSKQEAATIIDIFAAADMRLKRSDAEPWLLLETSLVRLANKR